MWGWHFSMSIRAQETAARAFAAAKRKEGVGMELWCGSIASPREIVGIRYYEYPGQSAELDFHCDFATRGLDPIQTRPVDPPYTPSDAMLGIEEHCYDLEEGKFYIDGLQDLSVGLTGIFTVEDGEEIPVSREEALSYAARLEPARQEARVSCPFEILD